LIRSIYISFLLSLFSQFGLAQDIIIQPPIFTPFECTEFYNLYTGFVSNFSQESYTTQLLLEVEYTSPAGTTIRLADGLLRGNPSADFPPGVTIIDNTNFERIYSDRQITFYDREIENLLATSKCLPPGEYEVCLSLYDINASISSADFLTQTCYVRAKQMFSSLLLVSPFEGEEILIDLPLFTWTAVTPFNPNAMYRIQIVEILANQTPFEALRSNPVFFEQSGLMSNIFQYPVAARTMLPCTQYAWRVTYELQSGFVSTAFQTIPDFLQQSEVWTMQKPCDEEEEDTGEEEEDWIKEYFIPTTYHVKTYEYRGTKFRFEIDNPYAEGTPLDFIIYDDSGQPLRYESSSNGPGWDHAEASNDQEGLKKGTNLLKIDTDKIDLKEGEYYTIQFTGLKEDLMIKFKYLGNEE